MEDSHEFKSALMQGPHTSLNNPDQKDDLQISRETSDKADPDNITFDDLIQGREKGQFQARTTPLRWAIFLFFVLNILVGSSTSLTFAPIATPISKEFGVSMIWVNMLSNVYNATYVPMTFLAMYMFNKTTPDWPIRIASILFLAGAWIRSLFIIGNAFWPLIVGQTLISCSFPIFTCAITLIANKWYTDSEREIVISMCGIAIPAGNLIAFVWTGFAFHGAPVGAELIEVLRVMLLNNNYLITALTVPMIVCIREKPEFPPSVVATKKPKQRNFIPQVREAIRDRNFVVLMLIFMMINGSFVAIGTNISTIYGSPKLKGGEFSPSQVSEIGGVTTILGIVSAFAFGYILKRTHKNLLLLRICVIGSFLILSLGVYIFHTGDKIAIVTISFISGCLQIPAVPVSINFASEITFPQEASVITGFLLMSSRFSGFVIAIITGIFAQYGPEEAVIFLAFINLLGLLFSIPLKEDLKKYKFSQLKEGSARQAIRPSYVSEAFAFFRLSVIGELKTDDVMLEIKPEN